jgi:hypothetical protein
VRVRMRERVLLPVRLTLPAWLQRASGMPYHMGSEPPFRPCRWRCCLSLLGDVSSCTATLLVSAAYSMEVHPPTLGNPYGAHRSWEVAHSLDRG